MVLVESSVKRTQEVFQQLTYDNFDRVLTNRDALGGITSYTYDLVGNMLTKQMLMES